MILIGMIGGFAVYAVDRLTLRAKPDAHFWLIESAIIHHGRCRYLGWHVTADGLQPAVLWMSGRKEIGTRIALLVDAAFAKTKPKGG